jgi:murein DD-endopeptidase MepM/ murein hydrolase activator NlpD
MICCCTIALIIGPTSAIAIPNKPQLVAGSGEPIEPISDEISPEQEQAMWEEIQQNISMLGGTSALMKPNTEQATALGWPLQMVPGLPDYANFRISAFVDHNPTSGQVLDYNGGTRTYDSHRGTDIALYPFSWNKLDANETQVIAAAAGTIVAKANVDSSDHNCLASTDPWNYVALVHADGRMTIYGHMRYNSLTSKGIGATVAQGEYLGIVGSSGNSSGPHLHFEVRYGSFSTAEMIDPYAGQASQPTSLWASQRPYYDSAVDRLSTHSAPPSTPDLCKPTITNLQDSFTTPRIIYFYTYYRDYQGSLATQFTLYRPDGSIFQSSQYAPNNGFNSAWSYGWVANFSNSEPAGTWRFEAIYNGQTYQSFFNINAPPTLTLSSPNGGEQWDNLLAHPITWAGNVGGEVNIALYHNGVYLAPIAYNTPSDGVYMWSAGLGIPLGTGYTIRVSSVLNPAISDESNASFSLIPTTLTNHDYLPLIQQ